VSTLHPSPSGASVEVRRTTCSRDCPDACGILATVENGRVTKLAGDPQHPVTKGFLCFRTSRFLELQHGDTRLRQPLLRKGRDLEPVSWDEAVAVAAERLERIRAESGPAAIFHYRSGGSLGLLKSLADRFFEELGPCTTKIGDICSGAGEAAQIEDFGVSESSDLTTLLDSRNIVLWGKNPTVSNVHLVPILKEARERGATLWLVDPVHHQAAGLVDRNLRPRPGGDLELALAVAGVLFERNAIPAETASRCEDLDGFRALVEARSIGERAVAAGVEEGDVRELAAAFADGPTAIQVGWGMQRRLQGAAIVRALDALSAVSGNLYRRGGGCSFYFGRRTAFRPFHAGPAIAPRTIREPMFGRDVLAARDPAIRCLWITAGNPVAMLPDAANVARAIETTEFTVVVDPLLTETGRRADLVIPVPTLLEDDDVLGSYGHHFLAESRPVVPPPVDVRPEPELFQELARRLGFADRFPQGTIDELKAQLLADVADDGAGLEALRAGPVRNPKAATVLFEDGRVHTPSGRVRLITDVPERDVPAPPSTEATEGSAPESEPLWLFSNSTKQSQASQWAGRGIGDRVWVVTHPDAVPGADDGDDVEIRSVVGSLVARLVHDPQQRPDVAIVPKGGAFDPGHCANALIPARPTDQGLGAAYLDTLVRIRRKG